MQIWRESNVYQGKEEAVDDQKQHVRQQFEWLDQGQAPNPQQSRNKNQSYQFLQQHLHLGTFSHSFQHSSEVLCSSEVGLRDWINYLFTRISLLRYIHSKWTLLITGLLTSVFLTDHWQMHAQQYCGSKLQWASCYKDCCFVKMQNHCAANSIVCPFPTPLPTPFLAVCLYVCIWWK